MKIALISVTGGGNAVSEKIAGGLRGHQCKRFAYEKYAAKGAEAFSKLSVLVDALFPVYDALVFISACGIAVRAVAPHVSSKVSDPAVVAVDEKGKFAVSLLSGHLGGANRLTEVIGEIIGAVPVITTATDTGKLFSPDTFAAANGLRICDMGMAKECAAALLRGEKLGFYSDYPWRNMPPEIIGGEAETGLCVSADTTKKPFQNTLNLVPVNLVLGVGCRKNIEAEVFEKRVLAVLKENGIPLPRIKHLASIDLKKDEKAILQFCGQYGLKFKTYTAEVLMRVGGVFESSAFVFKTTGSDNVCERSACAGGGKIIVKKNAAQGVTVSVAEEPFESDFNRQLF